MALLCLGAPDSLPSGSWARTATFSSMSAALLCLAPFSCSAHPFPAHTLTFTLPWSGVGPSALVVTTSLVSLLAVQPPDPRLCSAQSEEQQGHHIGYAPGARAKGGMEETPPFLTSTLSGTTRPYSLSSGGAGQSPVLLPQ